MSSEQPSVLVVEDDHDMRDFIGEVLDEQGYAVTVAANGKEAMERLEHRDFPIIVTDLKMPVMDGRTLLAGISARQAMRPFVIVITAFGDIDEAVELAMRRKIARLERMTATGAESRDLIGRSAPMRRLFHLVGRIAGASGSVLIEGETGTGKEVVARAIHRASARKDKPFVAVNCAAIPEGLLESELFGHVRGAFTDAVSTRDGLFLEAAGGTILLDEIGEMDPVIQAKVLRVLQEKQVRPVGAGRPVPVDARVIAATNRTLRDEVEQGRFREDLYYRLNIFRLTLPPLRQRREDIPLLIDEFLGRHERAGRRARLCREVMRFFLDYPWPGNIRELENVIERCVFLAEDGRITLEDLPEEMLASCRPGKGFTWTTIRPLTEVEEAYIRHVLDHCDGNKQQAAALLGINRKTIRRRLAGGR